MHFLFYFIFYIYLFSALVQYSLSLSNQNQMLSSSTPKLPSSNKKNDSKFQDIFPKTRTTGFNHNKTEIKVPLKNYPSKLFQSDSKNSTFSSDITSQHLMYQTSPHLMYQGRNMIKSNQERIPEQSTSLVESNHIQAQSLNIESSSVSRKTPVMVLINHQSPGNSFSPIRQSQMVGNPLIPIFAMQSAETPLRINSSNMNKVSSPNTTGTESPFPTNSISLSISNNIPSPLPLTQNPINFSTTSTDLVPVIEQSERLAAEKSIISNNIHTNEKSQRSRINILRNGGNSNKKTS